MSNRRRFAITQNGVEIMRGDKDSMLGIFNNLTGKNFAGSVEAEYERYLKFVEEDLHLKIIPERLALVEVAEGKEF